MEKRTILVTGANRGIGLAICEALSSQGHFKVLMGMREPSEATKLPHAQGVKLDLSTREGLASDLQKILEQYGPIDDSSIMREFCMKATLGLLILVTMIMHSESIPLHL